jgi:hypothetical protein
MYFKTRTAPKSKGEFEIGPGTQVHESNDRPHCFALVSKSRQRLLTLQAETELDKSEWMGGLKYEMLTRHLSYGFGRA